MSKQSKSENQAGICKSFSSLLGRPIAEYSASLRDRAFSGCPPGALGNAARPPAVFRDVVCGCLHHIGDDRCLRWSYDLPFVRLAQPVVACVLPPLAWLLFLGLTQSRNRVQRLPHAVPVGLVLALSALAPWWHSYSDAILTASYFGYGPALLHFASSGPDRLVNVHFSDAPSANRAALVSGAMLIVSGAVGLLIAGVFFLNHGTHVRPIIAVANLITLPLLACAVTFVGQTLPVSDELPEAPFATHPPVSGKLSAALLFL